MERTLLKQVSPESEKGDKKLVSVSATSILMTGTREEAVEAVEAVGTVETIEIAEVGEEGKESKDEYPNLARV